MTNANRSPVRKDGANIRVHRDTHAIAKAVQATRLLRTGEQTDLADLTREAFLLLRAQEGKETR
jgi:hypothetical protein